MALWRFQNPDGGRAAGRQSPQRAGTEARGRVGAAHKHAGAQARMRGWRNTVGSLIESAWLKKTYRGPQSTGMCIKTRGVQFHRVRDFKRYYFECLPPTSQRPASRNFSPVAFT